MFVADDVVVDVGAIVIGCFVLFWWWLLFVLYGKFREPTHSQNFQYALLFVVVVVVVIVVVSVVIVIVITIICSSSCFIAASAAASAAAVVVVSYRRVKGFHTVIVLS